MCNQMHTLICRQFPPSFSPKYINSIDQGIIATTVYSVNSFNGILANPAGIEIA